RTTRIAAYEHRHRATHDSASLRAASGNSDLSQLSERTTPACRARPLDHLATGRSGPPSRGSQSSAEDVSACQAHRTAAPSAQAGASTAGRVRRPVGAVMAAGHDRPTPRLFLAVPLTTREDLLPLALGPKLASLLVGLLVAL